MWTIRPPRFADIKYLNHKTYSLQYCVVSNGECNVITKHGSFDELLKIVNKLTKRYFTCRRKGKVYNG